MEFISLGGLFPGLSTDDIRDSVFKPRNTKLANIFHRLHLVESYGIGIRKLFNLYKNCYEQPVTKVKPNTFKIILPKMNNL